MCIISTDVYSNWMAISIKRLCSSLNVFCSTVHLRRSIACGCELWMSVCLGCRSRCECWRRRRRRSAYRWTRCAPSCRPSSGARSTWTTSLRTALQPLPSLRPLAARESPSPTSLTRTHTRVHSLGSHLDAFSTLSTEYSRCALLPYGYSLDTDLRFLRFKQNFLVSFFSSKTSFLIYVEKILPLHEQ